jgi:hypothetical protein
VQKVHEKDRPYIKNRLSTNVFIDKFLFEKSFRNVWIIFKRIILRVEYKNYNDEECGLLTYFVYDVLNESRQNIVLRKIVDNQKDQQLKHE